MLVTVTASPACPKPLRKDIARCRLVRGLNYSPAASQVACPEPSYEPLTGGSWELCQAQYGLFKLRDSEGSKQVKVGREEIVMPIPAAEPWLSPRSPRIPCLSKGSPKGGFLGPG